MRNQRNGRASLPVQVLRILLLLAILAFLLPYLIRTVSDWLFPAPLNPDELPVGYWQSLPTGEGFLELCRIGYTAPGTGYDEA